ncbi:hypothetical protein J6590_069559 [Homalodisca vitripennis]|nr:hypothetical protein J6590_069559 [Homalodisca vitripennis]
MPMIPDNKDHRCRFPGCDSKKARMQCSTFPMRTEHRDQASICPFALREVSVLAELALGHLRYSLTDVPPQSNSPPGSVLGSDHARECLPVGVGARPA